MLSRFKPPLSPAIWFLGSLWAAAIVFVIARAVLPT
jgi:hypothetical protein